MAGVEPLILDAASAAKKLLEDDSNIRLQASCKEYFDFARTSGEGRGLRLAWGKGGF